MSTSQTYSTHASGLPDPKRQAEFYESVPVKRLLAWIIDTVLILLLCVLILPFTAFTGIFFFPLMVLVIGFAYRIVTITGGSATWGMRMMSIEFRQDDGSRFDLSTAFWHTVGFSLSWAITPLQLVSALLMVLSARGQGLTDHVLGTAVLNRRNY